MPPSSDERYAYIILTRQLPTRDYEIGDGYSLRPIRPTREMVDDGLCNVHTQRMALPFIDVSSYNVYRDLVMFHSFVGDDPETYRYAEHLEHQCSSPFLEAGLDYIDDLATSEAAHPYGGPVRCAATDFDHYPTVIFRDPQDVATRTGGNEKAPAVPERWSPWFRGMQYRQDDQTAYAHIDYAAALRLYRSLRRTDPNLRAAIDLCVFAGSLWDLVQVYRNDLMTAALYVAALESVMHAPKHCSGRARCATCGEEVTHRIESMERSFLDEYGDWFREPRRSRHRFIHRVAQLDVPDALHEIYDKYESTRASMTESDRTKEDKLWGLRDEMEKLGVVTRKRLLELFLSHYYREADAS